ncbi:MAG: hypothetical protein AB7G93_09715 [Bdellovibrionales bacterium]
MVRFFISLFFVCCSNTAFAAQSHNDAWVTLSEPEIYKRCYVRLVRMPPDPDDALLKQVESGTKAGAAACLSLLDRAQLVPASGGRLMLSNTNDKIAIRILKTLNDLHRTWFQNKVSQQQFSIATGLLRDYEEPALYFTRAALGKGELYSGVVSGEKALRGLRKRTLTPNLEPFKAQAFFTPFRDRPQGRVVIAYYSALQANKATPVEVPDSKLVTVGDLVGIGPGTNLTVPTNYRMGRTGTYNGVPLSTCKISATASPDSGCLDYRDALADVRDNIPVHPHFGGGILGSPTFISNNTNLILLNLPDGEGTIHRRIGARIFEDLMCMQLPVINSTDVPNSEVITSSPHPFRHSKACMSCHLSMDGAAFTYRNIQLFESANRAAVNNLVGEAVEEWIRLPVKAGSSVHALQGPKGRFVYRQKLSPGQKTDVQVNGLEDLGAKVAATREFYLCAAKRYYRFLTGVDVNLETAETDTVGARHQKVVVDLANKMKTDKSVRTLFKRIFESDEFKTRNYRAEDLK